MYPDIDIKVTNFEQFDKELQRFKSDIKTKARRSGLVEVAKPIKKYLKTAIPRGESGALQDSIGHAAVPKGDKAALNLDADSEAIIVGSTRRVLDGSGKKRYQQYKLHFLDKGTKPHVIKARNARGLKIPTSGVRTINRGEAKFKYYVEIHHPGVKARGYLKKAYSSVKGSMGALFERGAARALTRYGVK